jgi:hypothetical protein
VPGRSWQPAARPYLPQPPLANGIARKITTRRQRSKSGFTCVRIPVRASFGKTPMVEASNVSALKPSVGRRSEPCLPQILRSFMAAMLSFAVSTNALAGDLERLARDGYGVLDSTTLIGEFNGCNLGAKLPLANGLIFVCSEHHFGDVFEPEVLILKSVKTGGTKVLIDGDEFEGAIFRR